MGRQQKAMRSKKQAVCYQTYMTIVLLIFFWAVAHSSHRKTGSVLRPFSEDKSLRCKAYWWASREVSVFHPPRHRWGRQQVIHCLAFGAPLHLAAAPSVTSSFCCSLKKDFSSAHLHRSSWLMTFTTSERNTAKLREAIMIF